MKGVVRKIDPLGRLVIPKEIRDRIGFSTGDPVQISVKDKKVIIEKYSEACIICGKEKDLFKINGKNICLSCAEKISKGIVNK